MKKLIAYILGMLAILAVAFLAINSGHVVHVSLGCVALLAGLPMLGIVGTLGKEEDFQETVLKGIQTQKSQVDTLVANYDNLSKQTKQAFDDLSSLKKHANDSQASMTETMRKMVEIERRLKLEARSAFGNPIQRILADEEKRTRFNMAIRLAVNGSNGDMLQVIRAGYPSELVKRALGEDSSPGSTIIDDALASEIYDTLATYGVWNTFRVQRLGTKQTKFPVKTARPVANFILTEGGTIADDTTKAGTSVTLEVEVISALLNVSLQLLQDAEVDITADVLGDFSEAFALRLDYACLQATGAGDGTNGSMTGIFGGGGTAAAAAATHSTVETTTLADWTNCLLTVDPAVLSRPSRWWMHPQILVRSINIKDSNGRPIFMTANEAPTVGGIGSILGYPVTLAHAAPTTNAAAAKVAVFGDPSGQVVGIRNDFQFEASDQFRWNTYERSFRGIGRAGTKIRRAAAFAVLTLTA